MLGIGLAVVTDLLVEPRCDSRGGLPFLRLRSQDAARGNGIKGVWPGLTGLEDSFPEHQQLFHVLGRNGQCGLRPNFA